jgi:hypothetical protein
VVSVLTPNPVGPPWRADRCATRGEGRAWGWRNQGHVWGDGATGWSRLGVARPGVAPGDGATRAAPGDRHSHAGTVPWGGATGAAPGDRHSHAGTVPWGGATRAAPGVAPPGGRVVRPGGSDHASGRETRPGAVIWLAAARG